MWENTAFAVCVKIKRKLLVVKTKLRYRLPCEWMMEYHNKPIFDRHIKIIQF